MKRIFYFIALFLLTEVTVFSQNIAITDDDGYNADKSAMLDVKSTTKGILIPRVTTYQRLSIYSPAKGLLVFDTDVNAFFFYNGSMWVDLTTSLDSPWLANSSGIYIADTTLNMGIGTTSADGKFEVRGDGNGGSGELLFAVRNSNGDTVFAVYDGGVRIYVDESSKGVRGGFAVGGYGGAKGTTEYLRVTPDSVRIYVNESVDKGVRGGFAVGGYGGAKGEVNELLRVTPDSVRIYVNESTAKGVRGGFAVGGYGGAKSVGNEYLRVTPDSVRVYVDETAKGVRGGFAVGGYGGAKGETSSYMQIDKDNYFIGLGAGVNNVGGLYNSFLGYNAGYNNSEGDRNIYLGYKSGYFGSDVNYNIFIGNGSGYNNTSGDNNVFMGYQSGLNNVSGSNNTYLGNGAGYSSANSSAYDNVVVGNNAGYLLESGSDNVFMGKNAGYNNTSGESNIFIGRSAGYKNQGGEHNIFMGTVSGYSATNSEYNIFIGDSSGYFTNNTFAYKNVFIGYTAGKNTQSYSNIFIGNQAGYTNSSGQNNIAIGERAGFKNTSSQNIFIGTSAGENNDDGFFNIMIGRHAGQDNISGSEQILIGGGAGGSLTTGGENVMIGTNAGAVNSTGTGNVYIGYWSGWSNKGSKNVFIGYKVGRDAFETKSNILAIDNEATASPLIYGEFDNNLLAVNGSLAVNTTYTGSHKLFVTSANTGTAGTTMYTENTASGGIALWAQNTNSSSYDLALLAVTRGTGDIVRFDSYHGNNTWDDEFRFDNDGDGYCDGAWHGGGADYAEYFPKSDTYSIYETGDIIMMSPVYSYTAEGATKDNANLLLGVYSDNPAVVGNSPAEDISHNNDILVGLMGVVKTKVSTENGAIKIGDLITISSTPKVGMKATESGMIVGRAMDNYDKDGIGLIKVFVEVDWYYNIEEGSVTSSTIKETLNKQQLEIESLKAEIEQLKRTNLSLGKNIEEIENIKAEVEKSKELQKQIDKINEYLNIKADSGE